MLRIPGSSYKILALYLMLTAGACFLIAGIVPMVVLLAGLAVTIRRNDLRCLKNAGAFIAWFYGVVAMVALLVMASHVASLTDPRLISLTVVEHQANVRFFGAVSGLSALGWALTRFLLLPAFAPYGRAVATLGFWGARAVSGADNRLAEELSKWAVMQREMAAQGQAEVAERSALARAA